MKKGVYKNNSFDIFVRTEYLERKLHGTAHFFFYTKVGGQYVM